MIRTKLVDEKRRQQRLQDKSLDSLFRRRIEQGANCAPFVSQAILQTVKDVFALATDDTANPLGLGQIKLLVVAAHEPAGKSLEQCQKVIVTLTLDAGLDDYQTRQSYGLDGLRRARLLRLTAEARE